MYTSHVRPLLIITARRRRLSPSFFLPARLFSIILVIFAITSLATLSLQQAGFFLFFFLCVSVCSPSSLLIEAYLKSIRCTFLCVCCMDDGHCCKWKELGKKLCFKCKQNLFAPLEARIAGRKVHTRLPMCDLSPPLSVYILLSFSSSFFPFACTVCRPVDGPRLAGCGAQGKGRLDRSGR